MEEETIDNKIKIALKKAKGYDDPDPDTVPNDTEMSDFDYSDHQLYYLSELLTEIVEEYDNDEEVLQSDINNCETVQDCIDMIKRKCGI